MRTALLSALLALPFLLCSQSAPQANNWHFANGIHIEFIDGVPTLGGESSMAAFEGACSISNRQGQLLFYSNGGGRPVGNGGGSEPDQDYGTIWNRNHEVMYDMRGEEGGGFSARQSALAMPAPGNPLVYYLWTMEEAEFNIGGSVSGQPVGRGLSYFTIDITLNEVTGGVVLADQRVYTPAYEGLDATPMESTDGYWIACHNNESGPAGRLVVVPLTEAGVGAPVEHPLGPAGADGRIKFSPDGRYVYLAGIVYRFDPATGMPGEVVLTVPGLSDQNATFTPDSRYLYGTEAVGPLSNVIVRYDVETGEQQPIAALQDPASPNIVLVNAPFQIGPNGNIYFTETEVSPMTNNTAGFSEISCVSGPLPEVRRSVVDLTSFLTTDNFIMYPPQFVDALFRAPAFMDTVVLDTVLTYVCPPANGELAARVAGDTYNWSTGDTTERIVITGSGEYCVTVSDGCSVFVDCQDALLEDTSQDPELLDRFLIDCQLNYEFTMNTASTFDSIRVSIGFPGPGDEFNILWRGGFATDLLVFPQLPPNENGQLPEVRVTIGSPCDFTLLDISPLLDPTPITATAQVVFAESDFCVGDDLELVVIGTDGPDIVEIVWSDGVSANPYLVTLAPDSIYTATVVSECGDTTTVTASPEVSDICDCEFVFPDVITPNNDGTNDEFTVLTNCQPLPDYTLLIFNRWGQKVFASTDSGERWDGTVNGTPVNMDTYLYRAVFRSPDGTGLQEMEGQFSVIR